MWAPLKYTHQVAEGVGIGGASFEQRGKWSPEEQGTLAKLLKVSELEAQQMSNVASGVLMQLKARTVQQVAQQVEEVSA